jgi:hypothetical protein
MELGKKQRCVFMFLLHLRKTAIEMFHMMLTVRKAWHRLVSSFSIMHFLEGKRTCGE